MSEKRRKVGRIIDRLFPQLAGMEDRLKPINSPETTLEERMLLVHNLLKQETPNLDALLCDRARRRRVSRGRFVGMGIGDWKIYDQDANLLLQAIRVREYVYFRLGFMKSQKFAQLCAKFDERQSFLNKTEYDHVDATRFFSFSPAILTASDWNYWLRLATLTEEEAVALSLGKNPDIICLATLKAERANDSRPSPFFEEYQLRLRSIQRAAASGVFGGSLDIQKLTAWARASKFDMPAQLMDFRHSRSETVDLVEEMNPKARKTLRLMVLFMAVNKYGHKLDGNSTATKNIVNRLAEYGISIDNKTVKTLLTDAAEDEALAEYVELLRKHARSS